MTNYLAQKNAIPLRLNAVNINYSTIIGSSIVFTSSIRGSTINNNIIVTQFINYSTITGSTINAGSLTANGLSFSTLTGSTLNTSTITMTNATGLGSTFAITNGTSAVTHSATPQYQLDISETTRATTVEYSDGSDTVTAAPPLDYSQFGQIWTPVNQLPRATWTAVAISASGQYQTVGSNGSGIYYSSNYGQTWTFASMSGYIIDVKISASGQYQIAAISGGGINYSSNYGQTWTASSSAPNLNWRSVCISASGQYGSAGAITLGNANTFSYVTSNYGQTWTASSFTGFNFAMACSASGQYQVSGQGNNGGIPGIFFSSNYGRNFTISNNTTSQAAWFAAMSATGQYVVVTTNPVSNISMFVSNNYGRTFINITLGFMSYGATMSASGQYQMVTAYSSGNGYGTGIYYSANYGQTWTLSPSTASLGGMLQVATSANGQYSLACPVAAGSVYQSITPFANTMASINLLTQTLQPTALTFSDGSALTSASDPLDYSTFGINWTQSGSTSQTWNAPAMSASGQYQIACIFNGLPYYSSNYGQTWTVATGAPSDQWGCASMSASGQYALIIRTSNNFPAATTVYISSNYGQTWSATTVSGAGSCCVSASGQYMAICNNNSNGGISVSSNYGQTWTATLTNTLVYLMTMSATGQYMYGIQYGGTYLYFISRNYGQTWLSYSLPASTYLPQSIACSASGQYVVMGGGSSGSNGGFQYSSNYGITFTQSASYANSVVGYGMAMSQSGQYIIALVLNTLAYYSTNYGITWNAATISGSTNLYRCAISANGQYLLASNIGSGIIYTSITRFPPLSLNNIPQPNALSSATNPGYTTLPGGIIMQFGNGSFTPTIANGVPGTQFFVYFPKPFTTACYGVQVSLGDLGAGTNYMQMFPSASFTNTYFAFAVKGVQGQGTYTTNTTTYNYIAYGK